MDSPTQLYVIKKPIFFSPCRVYRAALLGPDYVAELSLPSRPVVVPKPYISKAYLLTRVSTKVGDLSTTTLEVIPKEN